MATKDIKDSIRRTPRSPPTAIKGFRRGVDNDIEIKPPRDTPREDKLKRFGPCHVEARQAHTAILLLRSEERHIVMESLNSLQKFCKKRPENKEIFAELGGPEAALQLIFHSHQVIQRIALKLLAMSAPIDRVKLLFRDQDTVKDMILLIQSEDNVVVEYATVILSNTATLYTGSLQIIQNDGVPFLINLTQHLDPDIQKNSAETLWRILKEPLNSYLLETPETLAHLMKICDSEYEAVQVIALSIIEEMTRRGSGVELVENSDCAEKLTAKFSTTMESGDIQRVILKVLINLASSATLCKIMSPVLPHIFTILDTSEDLQAQTLAVTLLGKMASIQIVATGLVDFGLTQTIVTLLNTHKDIGIREAAALTAAQLARLDHRAQVQLVMAIKALITLFGEKGITKDGYQNIMLALSIIIEDSGGSACPVFIEELGIKLLLKIFRDIETYSNETVISAITCVSILAKHWELRDWIVDRGLLSAMMNCLTRSQPQLVALACNAICGLLNDEIGRETFLRENGVKYLIDIVSHVEFPVAVSAVPIIHLIGTYSAAAKQMIEGGLLKAIWQRQDLISRNGPFRTAYERLVASHLSAKFAITGHIDPFEKLNSGFYDFGLLRKDEYFLTLKELKYDAESETKRKILYLNLDLDVHQDILGLNKSLQFMVEDKQTIEPYIQEVRQILETGTVRSEKNFVGAIACVVANKFDGPIDNWRFVAETEDMEIEELQVKFESLVVPITMLTNGATRPRALLFKAIADVFGIPCTLDRGGYKKYWNVVLLCSRKRVKAHCQCPDGKDNQAGPLYTEKLRRFVVDLIYKPGTLFPINSKEANAYCFF